MKLCTVVCKLYKLQCQIVKVSWLITHQLLWMNSRPFDEQQEVWCWETNGLTRKVRFKPIVELCSSLLQPPWQQTPQTVSNRVSASPVSAPPCGQSLCWRFFQCPQCLPAMPHSSYHTLDLWCPSPSSPSISLLTSLAPSFKAWTCWL